MSGDYKTEDKGAVHSYYILVGQDAPHGGASEYILYKCTIGQHLSQKYKYI